MKGSNFETVRQQNKPSSNFVIVIGREFGSGGRHIGKKIAEILSIPYYDSQLLDQAAEAEGLNPNFFRKHEEKRPNILKLLLQGAYGIADNFHTLPVSSEKIYNLQSKLIRKVSADNSCVIVGRNADFILKNHPQLLSVFLHAPESHRVQRILKRMEAADEEKALALLRQHDRRRESFYNYYTGDKKWGQANNYHLCLDTSLIDDDTIIDTIINLAKKRFLDQSES